MWTVNILFWAKGDVKVYLDDFGLLKNNMTCLCSSFSVEMLLTWKCPALYIKILRKRKVILALI